MDPTRRLGLVDSFLSMGHDLVGKVPGKCPAVEFEMARLAGKFTEELLQIFRDPRDAGEIQLHLWLRNLGSLPARSWLRYELSPLIVRMGLVPRPAGSPVLGRAIFPLNPPGQ
jgi:hypothetical protein